MPKRAAGLTAAKVQKAAPGRYGDGAGLYLLVRSAEARFFVFRYTRNGKMREMGLGPAIGRQAVSLVDARAKARKLYDIVRDGRDPLDEITAEKAAAKARAVQAQISGKTFREVAELYMDAHEASWKNAKHRQQWTNTLKAYAYPHMGALPVAEVDTSHVMAALEPVWRVKTETATRVRGRIESILDYAKARGWRSGENPARWRGHLDNLLPARSKVQEVEHHPALPYPEIGEFNANLRERTAIAARALEFTILTVGRTGEVVKARWPEFDLVKKIWTIPPERMKTKREHRVPLSARAVEILKEMVKLKMNEFVFPGTKANQALSNMAMLMLLERMKREDITVHGFRSTFKDWATEQTNFPNEVSEAALAHVVGDQTEAAYRRGDLFEKRRKLMDSWARYCATPLRAGNVVAMGARQGS